MPISYGSYEKQLKLLPIILNLDGSADITLKYGFIDNGSFMAFDEKVVKISPEGVRSVLDIQANTNLTRRDDLSLAIYNYLVANNLVEPGQIS
jgi:hypothetical protein